MTIVTRIEHPTKAQYSWDVRDLLLVVAGSILISICAPIAIPLPFTLVPIAIQAQVCLFLGAYLGSKRGSLAVMGFLAQGIFGLPVFAKGAAGLACLFGPTGGYLLGYLAGTFLTGYLVEKRAGEDKIKNVFLAMMAGNIVIFFLGWMQLSLFVGMSSAVVLGVLPFLIGDFLKLCLASRLWIKLR